MPLIQIALSKTFQRGAEASDHQQADGCDGLDRRREHARRHRCVIEEEESRDWGIDGNARSTADVHALARGKAA